MGILVMYPGPSRVKKAISFETLENVTFMKILVATEKPFAKAAVDGIREIVEGAGYELALLEKYADKAELLAQTEGASVRGVVSIEQGGSYSYDSLSNATRMETSADMGSSTFVQAALIEVSASVSVTYELQ